MRRRLNGPLLAVCIALAACIEPRPPVVTPQVTRVSSVSPAGLDLTLVLRVDNPNRFPLAVTAVSGTVYLGAGKRLGESRAEPGSWIGAQQGAEIESRLFIPWERLPALAEVLGRTHVPYDVVGRVTLGGDSLNVTLPFELHGKLSTQQLVAAGLRGLPGVAPRP